MLTYRFESMTAWAQPSPESVGQEPLAPKTNFRVETPKPLLPLAVSYPKGAEGEALVVVELTLSSRGTVEFARAIDASPLFAEAAVTAAKSWVFTPACRIEQPSGATTPMPARIRVEVLFRPDEVHPSDLPEEGTAERPTPATQASPPPVEVTIEGNRVPEARRLSRSDVRLLPGAFGDPFRAIEVLPGVTPVTSGLPFFYVRGAPPGNGGYYFGDIPMPALFHVGAGPGVLHPAFVESVTLYAGTAPVRFGRFAGAIVAAEPATPEGTSRTEMSLRLVDVGAFREQPLGSGNGNIMVAGRYSYTGLLVPLVVSGVELGYCDYQARASLALDPRNTVTVLAFGAHDYLAAEDDLGTRQELYDVTFHRARLSFAHRVGEGTALNTQLGVVWDDTSAGNRQGSAGGRLSKRGMTAAVELTHKASATSQLRAGVNVVLERLQTEIDAIASPENNDPIERDENGVNLEILPGPAIPDTYQELLLVARRLRRQGSFSGLFAPRNDTFAGLWLDLPWQPQSGFDITPGLRLDLYRTGSATAIAVEPRVIARLRVAPRLYALHAVGIAHQPPSLGAPVPGLSASVGEGLQRSVHSHAGVEWSVTDEFDASVTAFQSALFGGSDALGLFNLQRADMAVDASVDRVIGHAYGVEGYARGALSNGLSGFISYTLSRATRSVGRLRGPSTFDRTHVFNLALSYNIGKGFHVGGRGVFYTGGPAEVAYLDAAVSPPRGPAYLRLDWRAEKRWALEPPGSYLALVAETLNTTLSKESLDVSCYAYGCSVRQYGPVTIPSLGLEAKF